MPGRQSHGRSLTQQPSKPKNRGKASKARSQQNALNAFNIAQEHFPTKEKKTPRFRALDAEAERKHARDEDDDEEGDNDDEDEQPKRKRARPAGDDDGDYGSDSEGNEWRLGGLMEGDEDSEIESDDAFGDSDNEKFDEYTFGGSKAKSKKADDSDSGDDEGDSEDEEGETLGAEAIDLATALDQWEEESEDEPKKGPGSGSESDDSNSADSDDEESDDDAESASEGDDEPDADKLEALKGLVSGFGAKDEKTQQAPTKQKIDLGDLGLTGIDDPFMKNSVKLMNKESKEKRPGASKKLDIPLSRREQGRLDRSAAYDKTNETLSRWNDTVKQNRRAEHLSFPLAPDTGKAGIDKTSFQPIKPQPSSNDHEANILSILDEAGLTEQPKKEKEKVYDDDGNELTRKEIVARKRMEREKAAREAKRAARIKKIKSKAYHRVHRKQRERDAAAMEEADGEVDSEAEREAQDRRRALERVGQRHKESKWAKMGAKNKRAVWDEDFRAGLGEMARKDEELRRRKEGKAVDSDDETSSSGSDSDEGGETLLQKVNQALEEEDDAPQEGIMGMRFMRNAENAKRKMEREELERIKQYEEELLGIAQPEQDDQEIGRRAYGVKTGVADLKPTTNEFGANDSADEENGQAGEPRDKEDKPQLSSQSKWSSAAKSKKKAPREILSIPAAETPEAHETSKETYGGWSSKTPEKSKSKSTTATFDPTASTITRTKPQPKPRSSKTTTTTTNGQPNGGADPNDSDDSVSHMPLAIRDQELIDRTFAGDDVVAEFEAEKNAVAEQDDDKVIDNTLPGWGSWVGEGVSAKEQKRNKGRFVTKVEGVKKKNRQDAKLDRVIINEKRNKKNAQYLATQLPHPFESRQQYERSMRLPVGPEWQTKETFQDSTKPRVMVKQGVIAPIAKPH